ncbi:MAG: hypothetical protein NTZ73_02075 [Candidatus Diapherotrites archaeon]|nr:hypothetical protein [Candidatus Diapherotrites archaeon]
MNFMYAAIRIRGQVNLNHKMKKALDMLNLKKANHLSLWPESKGAKKMLERTQGNITFGEIDDATLKELLEEKAEVSVPSKNKKGEKTKAKKAGAEKTRAEVDVKQVIELLKKWKSPKEAGIKNCFRLAAPTKGYERGGIKKPYKLGGALGYRGKEINALIKKML